VPAHHGQGIGRRHCGSLERDLGYAHYGVGNGSFPEETDAETRESLSSEILVLQKTTIDPHFVP
jgi:hypothetical protein